MGGFAVGCELVYVSLSEGMYDVGLTESDTNIGATDGRSLCSDTG